MARLADPHGPFPFAGVYYPLSALPPALAAFARLVPPSYVFQSLRALLASGTFPAGLVQNLILGALLSVAYLIGASYFFVAIYKRNLRSGSIARFNAESLGDSGLRQPGQVSRRA